MIAECLVVEFRVTGDDCPVADAARATGASADARPPLMRADGHTFLHLTTPDPAVGEHLDADDRIRYIHGMAADGRHSYRCLSETPCAVHRLVDSGFLVDAIHHRGGTERYVGAVVGQDVLGGVLAAAGGTVGASVERISPLGDDGDDDAVAHRWDLTPAQEEAVETAYRMGYFSVPRGRPRARWPTVSGSRSPRSSNGSDGRSRRSSGSLRRRVARPTSGRPRTPERRSKEP